MARISIPYNLDDDAPMAAADAMPVLLERMANYLAIWESFDIRGPDMVPKASITRTHDSHGNLCEISGSHNGFFFKMSYDGGNLCLDIEILEWRDFKFGIELCQLQSLSYKESDTDRAEDRKPFLHFAWEQTTSDEPLFDWEHADDQQRQLQTMKHRKAMGLPEQIPPRFTGLMDPPSREAEARRKPRKQKREQ